MKKIIQFCAAGALLVFGCQCHPTTECGTWTFSGSANGNSFPMQASFSFNPSNCGKNCSVTQNCIIQMVSVFDLTDQTYKYASDQSQASARSTDYGWTIDQVDGWAYAYYGLNNDGTFDPTYNPPGNNTTPTTLYDAPSGWPPNTLFYALDVVISYQSQTCQNTIEGYYFWSWDRDQSGNILRFITGPAWKDLDQTFQKGVAAWNARAPGSPSQNQGGGQPTLPHAVGLPAFTDL